MELRHLKSFQAVADHLNFHRAAAALNLTQPALSRQIVQLEADLGKAVFLRDRKRVELTAAGRQLYRRVGALLESFEDVVRETREAGEGKRGALALGYTEASMSGFLPALLRSLRDALPEVTLHLRQEHSEQLAKEVVLGRLDLAFISFPTSDPALNSTPVAVEEIGIVLPDNHRLAGRKHLALKDLREERFILFPYRANPTLYSELLGACRVAGFSPREIEEADTRILAVNMVAAGLGVSFLSQHLRHYCGEGTVFRPLLRPRPTMRFFLIEPNNRALPLLPEVKHRVLALQKRPRRQL
ncbi:MAG: LysR family transcriptional regulator [Candidatus Methylacidiphilales bacterium]|nr:LysR family transcriptional regulator [Candidatus Methylacidiphilales bacterium]